MRRGFPLRPALGRIAHANAERSSHHPPQSRAVHGAPSAEKRSKMNTKPGIIGKKLGMTQLYKDDGTVQRVTVIDTTGLTVVGKRTKEKDGYTALVLGLTDAKEKHLTKAELGAFKKKNVAAKRIVRELRCAEDFAAKF